MLGDDQIFKCLQAGGIDDRVLITLVQVDISVDREAIIAQMVDKTL